MKKRVKEHRTKVEKHIFPFIEFCLTANNNFFGFDLHPLTSLKKLNYNKYKIGLIDKITKSKTLNKFLIYLKKPISNYILISEILAIIPCVPNIYWGQFKTIEDKTIRNKSIYVNCIVKENEDSIDLSTCDSAAR